MNDTLEKFTHYINDNPAAMARISYSVVLMLLMVIGVMYTNLSYYKNATAAMGKIIVATNADNTVLRSKLKVLETGFYRASENFSVYERDIAKDYNDKLSVIDRTEGQRKNVVFINYLSKVKMKPEYVNLIAGAFYDASLKYGIDSRELIATAWHESRFRPASKSHMGALGVMQIMSLWLNDDDFIFDNDIYSKADLLDPVKSIQAGAYIYNHYKMYWKGRGYNKDHSVRRLALLSYNRGHGRVSRLMRSGVNPANGYFKVISMKYAKLIKLEKTMI